jgi:hypothetical protein
VDCVAVVDQATALLRQRGRVTYRTLKRQFQLDDAVLEDLKEELIVGQRLTEDEAGRVLVWTGAAEMLPAAPFSSVPQASQPAPPEAAFLQKGRSHSSSSPSWSRHAACPRTDVLARRSIRLEDVQTTRFAGS